MVIPLHGKGVLRPEPLRSLRGDDPQLSVVLPTEQVTWKKRPLPVFFKGSCPKSLPHPTITTGARVGQPKRPTILGRTASKMDHSVLSKRLAGFGKVLKNEDSKDTKVVEHTLREDYGQEGLHFPHSLSTAPTDFFLSVSAYRSMHETHHPGYRPIFPLAQVPAHRPR